MEISPAKLYDSIKQNRKKGEKIKFNLKWPLLKVQVFMFPPIYHFHVANFSDLDLITGLEEIHTLQR